MPPELMAAASSSTLAVATTVHAALLVLRQQRSVKSLGAATLLLPGMAFTASPWFLPAPVWLAAAVLAHLVWFLACEKLVPAPAAQAQRATRPQTAGAATAARGAGVAAPAAAPAHAQGSGFEPGAGACRLPGERRHQDVPHGSSGGVRLRGRPVSHRPRAGGRQAAGALLLDQLAPEATGYVEISVKRQGVVSSMLHSTVRPGSMLAVRRPAGKFTYPEGDDRAIVFLAGGVGITPLMSMFRHAAAAEPTRPATLILSVKDERCIPFRHELDFLAARHPQARVAVVVSGGPFGLVARGPSPVGRFAGRINETLIGKLVPDVANSIFMICGPRADDGGDEATPRLAGRAEPGPLRGVRGSGRDLEGGRGSLQRVARRAPCRRRRRAPRVRARRRPHAATRSAVAWAWRADQSLLEAAEGAGAADPSSCRAGVCMTCRTRLLEGEVDCPSDSLDDADRDAGYILPCVSYAKGDCALDA